MNTTTIFHITIHCHQKGFLFPCHHHILIINRERTKNKCLEYYVWLSQSTICAEQEKPRICIKLWATVWGLKSIELSNIPYIGQMEIDCVRFLEITIITIMLQKNLCFNTYDLCWRTSFLYIYITRLCRQMMFDERIIMMCHSVYTRSNFTMTLNVCTPYQSALHNLWIVLWLLMPPISEKMGNVIHPQVFTRYGKLQIIFSLPIVHLQYRLHHTDWCFFWQFRCMDYGGRVRKEES